MIVKDFIEEFVAPNSLVRLWYQLSDGKYIGVIANDKPLMDWEILIRESYINKEVVGIASILVPGPYTEAINLVIKQ